MKNKIPALKTDEEAEHFVDMADLSEYDHSGFKPVQLVRDKDSEIQHSEVKCDVP